MAKLATRPVCAGKPRGDECQVVELADGRILMDIRQEQGAHRWQAESADGGQTWGQARPGLAETMVACAIERFPRANDRGDGDRLLWTGAQKSGAPPAGDPREP